MLVRKKILFTALSFFICFTSYAEEAERISIKILSASFIIGCAHSALNHNGLHPVATFIGANLAREKISSSCSSAFVHALTQSIRESCVTNDPPFSLNTTWLVAGWKCLSPVSGDQDED